MYTEHSRKFGLGSVTLTPEQLEAILADMGWDGTELDEEGASIPYRLLKEWFEKTLTLNFEAVVERHKERALVA